MCIGINNVPVFILIELKFGVLIHRLTGYSFLNCHVNILNSFKDIKLFVSPFRVKDGRVWQST